MNTRQQQLEAFGRLLDIMNDLRSKCPWDKKQTLESLRHLTIEETYELGDAILNNDLQEIKKELGDLLLHIVFYAKIGSETIDSSSSLTTGFDIADVCNEICDKLIHRHPHIYGDVVVGSEEEVSQNWEKLKLKEGNDSVLGGVPVSLPALVKSMRIQEKARAAGFDWEEPHQVWDKVKEEMDEFYEEVKNGNQKKMEAELGDLMFSLVNYARFLKLNPDEALERTNKKFIRRFQFMEGKVKDSGKKLEDLNLAEMDVYWNEAKAKGL